MRDAHPAVVHVHRRYVAGGRDARPYGGAVLDRYARAAPGWAAGAAHVYGPLARALVDAAPHPLAGRRVLDAGAGTGLAGDALTTAGARPVALDVSAPMLTAVPGDQPRVVGSVLALPLADAAMDDAVAAFVLNHVHAPVAALAELARVVRPDGAVLATVMSAGNSSPVRDRIDVVARAHGFTPPDWYAELTGEQAPLLGSADRMARAAHEAGLVAVRVEEAPADLGLTDPAALVDYRLGQAQFADWLAGLDPRTRSAIRAEALAAVAPGMEPYRPGVVQLTAQVPGDPVDPGADAAWRVRRPAGADTGGRR
ncbi:methyltransferase domain-containing protein [Actinomycetospora endophytica]|uniref:Methyltransferase domain-containing protein n=1 Tax=Actinomycetospora endophytica TaxID=2291215 RepID=A0ABS8P693_9PSEU|nr:methyltransferase domain-containing protein [Actinomycetospora endophytica]MCD2193782.1 methyltransferase domain-containing protein [Actinomycetospora endophytica]